MKSFTYIVLLLLTLNSFAQSMSGKAYYESKTTIDMDNFGREGMSEERKKQMADFMKGMLEKTYILTFNKNESIYKEQEKLETAGGSGRGFRMMMGSFTPGDQYKNLEKNQLLQEQEFFGKEFLIIDTIANLDWKLEKESKQIGQYVAFKATAIKNVDPNDFSMARRRNRDAESKEIKNDSITKEIEDPMDEIEIPKTVIVTAWYTPQIPISNGPGEYAGLPGLILEMNVERTTVLCSKIIMNPKEADAIQAPKKGKEVSREEYNKIVKEKTDEMRENFRGRGGRGGRHFGG